MTENKSLQSKSEASGATPLAKNLRSPISTDANANLKNIEFMSENVDISAVDDQMKTSEDNTSSDSGTPDITFNKRMTHGKLRLLDSSPIRHLLSKKDINAAKAEVETEAGTEAEAEAETEAEAWLGEMAAVAAEVGSGAGAGAQEGEGPEEETGTEVPKDFVVKIDKRDDARVSEDNDMNDVGDTINIDDKDIQNADSSDDGDENSSLDNDDNNDNDSLGNSPEKDDDDIDVHEDESDSDTNDVHESAENMTSVQVVKIKAVATMEKITVDKDTMGGQEAADKASIVREILEAPSDPDVNVGALLAVEGVEIKEKKQSKRKTASQRALLKATKSTGLDVSTGEKQQCAQQGKGAEKIVSADMANRKKNRAVKQKTDKSRKNKNKSTAIANLSTPGVIYLGHIPHGFYESEMRSYFSQFGQVSRLRLSRSKKTGRSRGYAFIEFADKDVAMTAANAMDGYLMHGCRLVAKFVPDEKVHPDTFKPSVRKIRSVKWSMIERRALISRSKDPKKVAQRSKGIKKSLEKKKERLAQLKINYKFPMLSSPPSTNN